MGGTCMLAHLIKPQPEAGGKGKGKARGSGAGSRFIVPGMSASLVFQIFLPRKFAV